MNKIETCLWFDNQGEEAAKFYTSLFKNAKLGGKAYYSKAASQATGQPQGSVMTQEFTIENQQVLALNGGPLFKFTPAASFTVWCDLEQEINDLWKKLSDKGQVRMELQEYPWSKKYGWTADKYGLDWQLMLAPKVNNWKIVPSLLFVDKSFGKAEEAIKFWMLQFPNSKIESIAKDPQNGSVLHCLFTLDGQPFVAMDGAGNHGFTFNEAFSLMIACKDQKEIDHYWSHLTAGGGKTSQCGWLSDRFGIHWQVVPENISSWLSDPKTSEKVHGVVMKCTKPILADIEAAASR